MSIRFENYEIKNITFYELENMLDHTIFGLKHMGGLCVKYSLRDNVLSREEFSLGVDINERTRMWARGFGNICLDSLNMTGLLVETLQLFFQKKTKLRCYHHVAGWC